MSIITDSHFYRLCVRYYEEEGMKNPINILFLGIAVGLFFACSMTNTMGRVRIIEMGISLPIVQRGMGSKSIVDTSVASVTVTAEDSSSGTSLGTADMTRGASAWTGTMTLTVRADQKVTFSARGWSQTGGTGYLLYYGEKEVDLSTDSTSVTIETASQLLTWTARTSAGSRNWGCIASSSDGTKLAAGVNTGSIWTSSDSGATWTERTEAGSRSWYSIASSSDGTKLAAVVFGGSLWTSSDSGATWIERTGAGNRYWTTISSSSDGTRLAAGVSGGYIYTSSDSGANWTEQTGPGILNCWGIASSSDGTKLAAAAYDGYIYTAEW